MLTTAKVLACRAPETRNISRKDAKAAKVGEAYGDPGLITEPFSASQFHLMAVAKSNCAVDYLARLQGQHRPDFAQLIVGHFQGVVAQHDEIGELARLD